jgi:hypothetical protein
MGCVETSIVFGQARVASVSKDALHKVQVRDATSRHKEAHLETFFGRHPWNFGTSQRTKQQRHHGLCRFGPLCCVRELVEVRWWLKSHLQETSVCDQGHRDLVGRDRKSIISNMKHTFGGALVVEWVVQHTILRQAVAVTNE